MKKRKSLKKVLLTQVIAFVIVVIAIITFISISMQADNQVLMSKNVLSKESISYASEVYNWWNSIENRVNQTANVYKNIPNLSDSDTLNMLLTLTKEDPDSQDIYIADGNTSKFFDGSGWVPDKDYVFKDREWYKGAMSAGGKIFSSQPYVDAATGKTCLACSILLRDNVVLSSDVNFDKVAEKMKGFKSSAGNINYYIINKENKNILVSNVENLTSDTVENSKNPIIGGLKSVFASLNTSNDVSADKVAMADTSQGKMLYTATDIQDTSWIVVSAVPYSYISDNITRSFIVTFVISVVLLIILAIILYIIINKYINPVTKVTDKITDISKGDFTVEIIPEGNNEITTLSESLNSYIKNMRNMLTNLANISGNMNKSAGKCNDITHNLSYSNQNQGDSIEKLNLTLSSINESIEEVADAATELADTSDKLAKNTENVKDLCQETMNSSRNGKSAMENMTRSVTTLNSTISSLTDIIKETSQSIKEITGITDTINEISEQTNLLSLNASIEAARAGEMGKGFAVVASEVGTLANQSSEATEIIRKLIINVTANIEEINRNADICINDMKACIEGVETTNESFDLIYKDVEKATEGILEITSGISHINDVAATNASTAEQQASSINEVLGLSEKIVAESNRILSETDSITNVSANLNNYSDAIKEDLEQYTL